MASIVELTSVSSGGLCTGRPLEGSSGGASMSLSDIGQGVPKKGDHVIALKLRGQWFFASEPKRLKPE